MNLYINDEKVDFTLESEKTLAEVIRSLERWLAGEKMVIAALSIDGVPFSQTDLEKKKSTAVDSLREIRVTASDFLKLEMEGTQVLTGFFQALVKSLRENDGHVADLLPRYPEAESTLRFLLGSREDADTAEKRAAWEKLFSGTTAGMIAMWDKKTHDQAVTLCDFFLRVLTEKDGEYKTIEQSSLKLIRDTIGKLRETTGRLSDVSILLQTGKDSEAMQTIALFTELTQLFISLVSTVLSPVKARAIVVEGEAVEAFSQRLNTHLRELIDAFEKKDYILIGDLCEYEIAPKIISFIDTVEGELPAATS